MLQNAWKVILQAFILYNKKPDRKVWFGAGAHKGFTKYK